MYMNNYPLATAASALVLGLLSQTATAAEAAAAKDGFSFGGSVYLGTVLRTTDADPGLLFAGNAAAIGVDGSAAAGKNQDDGNLNFDKGEPVSTSLKGQFDLRYVRGQYGAVVQAQAWYDDELENGDRPWGNAPNGYAADAPLSDAGYSSRSRYSGLAAGDVYVFGDYGRSGWKAGLQRIDWGGKFTMGGGLADLTPRDLPALRRAGATPDEGRVAVPAISGRYALSPAWTAEGFVQTHFQRNVPMGCGTFYSQVDFVAEGCDKVVVGTGSDRESIAAGTFVDRADTLTPSGLQGGLGLQHRFAELDATLGLYVTQFHSRKAYYGAIRSGRPAEQPLFVPNNPDGLNPLYFTEYPDDVRMAALNFNKKLKYGAVMAELSYSPNQPFQYNAADLLNAFLNKQAPTPLRAQASDLQPGERFSGYERHKTAQLKLGAAHGLPAMLGARSGLAALEMSYKWADLPDVGDMRFGRPDVYGQAPLAGAACAPGTASSTCSTDGYISDSSYGYRLRSSLRYPQLLAGLDLAPSLTYGQDLSGWSEDGVISAGRQFAVVAVEAELYQAYQFELSWQPVWGGDYNNIKDRDSLAISVGYQF